MEKMSLNMVAVAVKVHLPDNVAIWIKKPAKFTVTKMKAVLFVALMLASDIVNATEYDLPPCYSTMPVTCTFDQMTLDMCNAEGKNPGSMFLISQKIYMPGGNKFGSADGRKTCVVRHIKDTDPAKYEVTITK